MSFGAGFLHNPDLFPARPAGEPWGDRELVLDLPGGPYRFSGLSADQVESALGRFVKEEATAVEYLKMLALSRVYLENILNVQSSWVTPGLKTCQMGLKFGGNDVGSIMIEENVVSAAGTHNRASEEELRRLIRDAGFTGVEVAEERSYPGASVEAPEAPVRDAATALSSIKVRAWKA